MTEWFLRDQTGIGIHEEDPSMLLLGGPPDWVRAPADLPERGGEKIKVLAFENRLCIMCKKRMVRCLVLEHDYFVFECIPHGCGYAWAKGRTGG